MVGSKLLQTAVYAGAERNGEYGEFTLNTVYTGGIELIKQYGKMDLLAKKVLTSRNSMFHKP